MDGYQVGSLGASKYNMAPSAPTPEATHLHGSAIVTPVRKYGRLDPDNPVLWLTGIGALTLGFVAFSMHGRVGPISATVSAGS